MTAPFVAVLNGTYCVARYLSIYVSLFLFYYYFNLIKPRSFLFSPINRQLRIIDSLISRTHRYSDSGNGDGYQEDGRRAKDGRGRGDK